MNADADLICDEWQDRVSACPNSPIADWPRPLTSENIETVLGWSPEQHLKNIRHFVAHVGMDNYAAAFTRAKSYKRRMTYSTDQRKRWDAMLDEFYSPHI